MAEYICSELLKFSVCFHDNLDEQCVCVFAGHLLGKSKRALGGHHRSRYSQAARQRSRRLSHQSNGINSRWVPACLCETDLYYTAVNCSLPSLLIGWIHTQTSHPFNGPFSGTTQVSRYQKGKTNLDFTEARESEWRWHQLGHMQVCTSLQTDNHASTPPLSFYRPDDLPATHRMDSGSIMFLTCPSICLCVCTAMPAKAFSKLLVVKFSSLKISVRRICLFLFVNYCY